MRPVVPRSGRVDVVLKGPPGGDIGDLPAQRVQGGGFCSEWELDFDERKAIMDGARVVLWVMSAGHPPVSVEVEGVDYLGGGQGHGPG